MNMQSGFSHNPACDGSNTKSGFAIGTPLPLYRGDIVNACPGCGKSQWLIGRVMAQCACCETALPLAQGWRFQGLDTL